LARISQLANPLSWRFTSLVDAGLEVACAGHVNLLTVPLVQPTEEQDSPLTVNPQAGKPGYVPDPVAAHYRRGHVLYRDLPSLSPTNMCPIDSDSALVDVARGLRDMVAEARAEMNDVSENRKESRRPKTVREKMDDTITDHLLLLCRASCDKELPRLYQEWAARTRGVSKRWVM
jgi:hypothetical protein